MTLGLYGGAFNPIHRGHLLAADTARTRLGLETVLFIPTGDPPHKPASDVLPAAHRLEMVRLAIAPSPSFRLSDIETRRSVKSYTVDTLRELRKTYPDETRFVFIIGLDAFLELPSWKEPERLLELCEFAVVSRPCNLFKSLEKIAILGITDPAPLERLDAGRSAVEELRLGNGRALWGLSMPPCDVSAQDIRNRLQRRQSAENLLPAAVSSYILQHNLFSGG